MAGAGRGGGGAAGDLAVSIPQITWFSSMVSPGATRQLTISASVRPSPTSGRGKVISLMDLSFGLDQ